MKIDEGIRNEVKPLKKDQARNRGTTEDSKEVTELVWRSSVNPHSDPGYGSRH
jgi:hypothetical protein